MGVGHRDANKAESETTVGIWGPLGTPRPPRAPGEEASQACLH